MCGMDERPDTMAALLGGFGFGLEALPSPKELCGTYLPHLTWRSHPGCTVAKYFNYAAAVKL